MSYWLIAYISFVVTKTYILMHGRTKVESILQYIIAQYKAKIVSSEHEFMLRA